MHYVNSDLHEPTVPPGPLRAAPGRVTRLALLLAGCSSVAGLSDSIYRRQMAAAAYEERGDRRAAETQRRAIEKDQAKLQRKESNVPAWHFPQ